MAKKVKCPVCQTLNEKEVAVAHSGRYYCPACFKEKTKLKPKGEWDFLFETIKQFYGDVTPVMFRQLKTYRENKEYRFTDAGMRLTLIYCHEVLGLQTNVGEQTLGIIPYYYHKAKKYWSEVYQIQALSESFEQKEKNRIIYASNEKGNQVKPFDFQAIDWSEMNES